MKYLLGSYLLDTEKHQLFLSHDESLASDNDRVYQVLMLLIDAYPEMVDKTVMIKRIWPNESPSEWALSRLIADIRHALAVHDDQTKFIKTLHGKGFRLGVKPILVDEPTDANSPTQIDGTENSENRSSSSNSFSATDYKSKKKSRRNWIFSGVILFSLASISGYWYQKKIAEPLDWRSNEKVAAAFSYQPPLSNWWSAEPDSIAYSPDGSEIIFSPIENLQMLAYFFNKPTYLQNSRFEMTLKVDQEFMSSHSTIQLFIQVQDRNWQPSWRCPDLEKVSAEFKTFSCSLDEPYDYWTVQKGEGVRLGLRVKGENQKGKIHVKSAQLHVPMNINMESEWDKNDPLFAAYQRGASYQPKATNDKLARVFKGPLDLRGKQVLFTLKADQAFLDSKASIQPLLYKVNEHRGMWDCSIDSKSIPEKEFTFRCPPLNHKDYFLLNDSDYLVIGIQPFGEQVKGTLKIIAISIVEPEENKPQ